jgi:hypothetical protein
MRVEEFKPVLYLAYNRPVETRQTFEILRKLGIKRLYIALDGPKDSKPDDVERCAEVRKIVEGVDWASDVKYLIRDKNLGCRWGVNGAIDWFFEHEEMGIILEDDILVERDFFEFCSECLELFCDDKRVMLVTGNNVLGEFRPQLPYVFSRIGAIWGWATWRRSWQIHDKEISYWPESKELGALYSVLPKEMAEVRSRICDEVFNGKIDTWDYQFTLTRLLNSGLSIVSSVNLVENIGFNLDATHTSEMPGYLDNKIRKLKSYDFISKQLVYPSNEFDLAVFYLQSSKSNLGRRIKNRLRLLKD